MRESAAPAPEETRGTDGENPGAPAGSVRIGEDGQAYVAVRKRKRRRRSLVEPSAQSPGRVQTLLLGFIIVLLLLALGGPGLRAQVIESLRQTAPALAQFARYRIEVIALVVAAGIVLYLMPGVEERVLTALGIKKRRRSHDRQRRDR